MAHHPPLHGIRVLDLSRLLPGPACTMHLADLGADVVKVEDPGAGDYAPPAMRMQLQRNKRALRLDLKRPAGVAALLRLARDSDVLLESFRPGVVDRLGIGYAAVARANPGIVYCSLSGYGQTGPLSQQAGHDLNYCGYAGVSSQIGRAGEVPALSNVPIADLMGGAMTAALGILAALLDAQRSGRGRHVDIAMADGALAQTLMPMATRARTGRTPDAGEDVLSGALPCYAHYRTQDGRYLAVGALERKFWDRFCSLIGREDLQPAHRSGDAAVSALVRGEITRIVAQHSLAHWQQVFADADCCVTPVLSLDEALAHPQFAARGMVLQTRHAAYGEAAQLACPVRMTDYRFEIRRPAPLPGEHTDEILRDSGYSDAQIAALRQQGAVA